VRFDGALWVVWFQWGDTGFAQYSIFNGYYQWDNDDWYQSSDTVVNAGDKIFGTCSSSLLPL
jgi:hypothetical protein